MIKCNVLHIITALYRFEYLEKIYDSINVNDDLIWHISKSNKREDLTNDFIKTETDGRVRITKVEFMENNKNSATYAE